MRAMILAAGRGTRLGELTQSTPKPLLPYKGKTFIEHRLIALARAGVKEVVINTWYHAEQIHACLGNGQKYGVTIHYSKEHELLDTGGGIKNALPLLGNEPFILTNADVVTDFDYANLPEQIAGLAHLVLVDNPPHHPCGDFHLDEKQVSLRMPDLPALTYSGIAVLSPALFDLTEEGVFSLVAVLYEAIKYGQVSGEHFKGWWCDIGRPDDLREVCG